MSITETKTTVTRRKVQWSTNGVPVPQGSKKAFMPKNGKVPIVVDDNKKTLREWRKAIRDDAVEAMSSCEACGIPIGVAVAIDIHFAMPRPKGHFGSGRRAAIVKDSSPEFPIKKPDLDKLTRAVFDSLTATVYRDDSQIVQLTTRKVFTDTSPSVTITVSAIEDEELPVAPF